MKKEKRQDVRSNPLANLVQELHIIYIVHCKDIQCLAQRRIDRSSPFWILQ